MDTLQLNRELLNELSTIASDEDMMRKAIKALRRIISNKKKSEEDETNYIMSSPKMVEILKQGDEEIKKGGGVAVRLDELWK